ncbi:hypothetical protein [Congregibacter litoralis]|uniref:Uncharacterized protein n=1 Tax=Congregibacter litoralis KT71 TaxID=314285 RepID=A4AD41_9GAMM|nr:hypothetical protein [Congregibacter litoralis]EAQ96094.1 hypothetical protein KT71_08560 [Congregibacter litoralis KT71]
MISRRQFLLGTATGFVLPRFFERALSVFENHGEALLQASTEAHTTVIASRDFTDNFTLYLGNPSEEPPEMTLREFVERYSFEPVEEALAEWADTGIEPDDTLDWSTVCDAWCLHDSPNARAYELLCDLDLGPNSSIDSPIGEVRFINGPCPGNDYKGVELPTALDVSLLQHRLNRLQTGVRIVMG